MSDSRETHDIWLYLNQLPDDAWVEEFGEVARHSQFQRPLRYEEHNGTPAIAYSDAEDSQIEELVQLADRAIEGANKRREARAKGDEEARRTQAAREADARRVAQRINRMA